MLVVMLVPMVVVLIVAVAMVACWWDGCHIAHSDVAPEFGERKMGERHGITHLTLRTVVMACIVTVWTTWHLATLLPACSIARRRLSRLGW